MAKILVADDDELLAELISSKFENAGHDVVTAFDGGAALEKINEAGFDLVVLDAMMPVMSGFEVLQAARENPANNDMLIVMLTARRGLEDVLKAMRSGIDDYLTKPFDPSVLLAQVNAMLLPGGALRTMEKCA
jgi:two-component system, OmpR family, response regulator